MKKIFKLLLVPALLIVFSCDQETVTDYWPEDLTAITAKGKKSRPIKNSLQSAPDPSGSGLTFFWGTMSHLGKVYGTVETTLFEEVYDGDGNLIAWHITSSDIVNASNGDLLYTFGDITIDLSGIDLSTVDAPGTIAPITGGSIIDGGTGRFKNATGEFFYHNMIIDVLTFEESHTSTGWIMY